MRPGCGRFSQCTLHGVTQSIEQVWGVASTKDFRTRGFVSAPAFGHPHFSSCIFLRQPPGGMPVCWEKTRVK